MVSVNLFLSILFYSYCHHSINMLILLEQNNQADLENATEVLSGYLERDISQDSLQDIKQKVQDKYRSVRRTVWNYFLLFVCLYTHVCIPIVFGFSPDTVRAGEECCYSTFMKAMRRTCGSTLRIEDTSQCNGLLSILTN